MEILKGVHLKKHFGHGLSLGFRARPIVNAVDDVSLELNEGEVLGLVGGSGSGKTTVALLLGKLIEPSSGAVFYKQQDISRFKDFLNRTFRREVQMVFQDPYTSIDPFFSIKDWVMEPLLIHKIGTLQERITSVNDAMKQVGLPDSDIFLHKYPQELSGGQLQRVALARAMVLQPSVLIADEPVSMLDVSIRAGVLELLRKFANDYHVSILYITHDISTLSRIADRLAVMHNGKIVESGLAADVLNNPMDSYTKELIGAIPDPASRFSKVS